MIGRRLVKRILVVVLSVVMLVTVMPQMQKTVEVQGNTSKSKSVESAINWAIKIANDNTHGYLWGGHGPTNYDCSGFVTAAFMQAGFKVSHTGTSGMKANFKKAGFNCYRKSDVELRRGDILLKPNSHVELYLGDNKCVAAHGNYDGKSGDSSGREIQVRSKNKCTYCNNKKYTYILRYSGSITNYKVTATTSTTYNSATITSKISPSAKATECKYLLSDNRSAIKNVDATKSNNLTTTKTYDCKKVDKSGKFTVNKYKGKNFSTGKPYYLKVAFKVNNRWWSSDIITATTQTVTPGKPSINITNVNSNIGLGGSPSISWNKCSSADSYDVQITNNSTKKSYTYNTKGTIYQFKSSIFNTVGTYSIKVTAKNDKKNNASSLATITVHKNIKVKFCVQDGKVTVDEQSIPYGTSAKLPPAPSQEGYTFVKWDKSVTNLRPKNEDEEYVVNAVFNLKSYKVKFIDGITGAIIGDIQTVEYGSAATAPNAPEHKHYNFVQWDKDFTNITENTEITAVYDWYNKDYALAIESVSAEQSTITDDDSKIAGYEINAKVHNPKNEKIQGRLVVALHTSTGLLLTTTESTAFNISANTTTDFTTFIPYDALAGYVTVYVVNNYDDAGIISEPLNYTIKNSKWSDLVPYDGICPISNTDDIEVETETKKIDQYRYKIRTTTTSKATSLSGYTRLSGYKKVDGVQKTIKYAYFHQGFDKSNSLYKNYYGKKVSASENDTQKVEINEDKRTGYIYWHWCEGKSASTPGNHLIDWKKGTTYKKFHAFESATKKDYKGTSYNAYVFSNKGVCSYNYNWNGYKSKQDNLTNVYTQKYTTYKKQYTYEKYSGYSDWTEYTGTVPYKNGQSAETNQTYQNVETRVKEQNYYKYKSKNGNVPDKEAAQKISHLEYSVGDEYNEKDATVFIYKYTQPSDFTNEYIGKVTIKDGKIVLDNVELREVLSAEVGDYTVAAAIQGNTGMIELGKIEAPKPTYTVNFYDYSEDPKNAKILYSTKVTQGETVIAPDSSEVNAPEGYEFDSWGQSTVNVQNDLNVYPTIKEKEIVVVYVDWGAQAVSMEEHTYGEILSAPSAAAVEGKNVTWDYENASNVYSTRVDVDGEEMIGYYATDNAIITTKQEDTTANVKFLGLDSEYAISNLDNIQEDDDQNIEDDNQDAEDDIYDDSNVDEIVEDSNVDSDEITVNKKDIVSEEAVVYGDRVETPNDIEESDEIEFYGWRNIKTGEYINDAQFAEGEVLENADVNDAIFAPVYEFSETCSVPEASVTTGEYDTSQTIELTCDTENAVIYYTTDESDPTKESKEYDGPITLTKPTTLRFCAMAMGMNNSGTVSEMYAINTSTSGAGYHIVSVYSDLPEEEGIYYQKFVKDSTLFKAPSIKDVEGYTYEGLYLDEEGTNAFDETSELITESISLYAKYTPKQYSVKFYEDDGEKVLINEQLVDYGLGAIEPSAPEKEGLKFIGWDTDVYEHVTGDVKCHAKYIPEDEYATVSLNKSTLTIMEGMEYSKLQATITPEDLSDTEVTWSSSDWEVASVDDEGLITANKAGTSVITVTVESTGESAECTVKVIGNYQTSIVLNEKSKLGIDSEGYLREIKSEYNFVEQILAQFNNDTESLYVEDVKGNKLENTSLVGTGAVIKFVQDNELLDTMSVVMTGDNDGDGHIGNIDVSKLNKWLAGTEDLTYAQQLACDVNGDGSIDNKDAAMISRYLVGKESIG